jgi:hypothetical protein
MTWKLDGVSVLFTKDSLISERGLRKMGYTIPKEKVKAVHDEDLEKFIDGLGMLNELKRGELKCKFCKTTITFKNLQSMFPQSGSVKFVCDSPDCAKELRTLLREGVVAL